MDITFKQIARVCHEANRAYCMAMGDFSIGTWDMAPQWQKDSAIEGVKDVLANPAMTPEQSHEKWMAHKLSKGWKYGPEKRPEVLEHPCLKPYDELPESQRAKDVLFLAVVRALSSMPAVPPVQEHEGSTHGRKRRGA